MTQENKELLKDLCARLPYGVKVNIIYSNENASSLRQRVCVEGDNELNTDIIGLYQHNEIDIRPYLFPLSSMTEEQLYNNPVGFVQMLIIKADRDWENITINRRAYYKLVDWLNKNHFDYRGLIEKGLALDATGLNIY